MPPRRQFPVLRARFEDGRVVWPGFEGQRWENIKRYMDRQDVEISVRPKQKKGSHRQRKYYWKVIVGMIAKAAGYDPSEYKELVHEALKQRFLREPGEGPLWITRSYESLSTAEREIYHEHCRRFAAEFYDGLYIPLPNEVPEWMYTDVA